MIDTFILAHIFIGAILAVALVIIALHAYPSRKERGAKGDNHSPALPVFLGGVITAALLVHVFIGVILTALLAIVALFFGYTGTVIITALVIVAVYAYTRIKKRGSKNDE